MLDAVVTAGGRLSKDEAAAVGTEVKALVRVGERTILRIVIDALRDVPDVERIVVVGPSEARAAVDGVDWIDEFPTGEENLLAALERARTGRVLMSSSDLPFVTSRSYADLLARAAPDAIAVYPIFSRAEFLRAYPSGRSSFVRLDGDEWTGGSAFVLHRETMLERAPLLRKAFGARKSPPTLARLLGLSLLVKLTLGVARIAEVEARASHLLGGKVVALKGEDPSLAMDCDCAQDFDYARARASA